MGEDGHAIYSSSSSTDAVAVDASEVETACTVFDPESLLDRLMQDRPLAEIVLAGFLSDCPTQLRTLGNLAELADARGLRLCAHSLKGASATVSAMQLSRAAYDLEVAAETIDPEQWACLIRIIAAAFHDLKEVLLAVGWQ